MKLELNKKLLDQREKLQQISFISYAYHQLNQNYRGGDLSDEEAAELIKVYDELLEKAALILKQINGKKTKD